MEEIYKLQDLKLEVIDKKLAQNKKDKKEIESRIKVKSLPFPKGDNKRYNVFESNSFATLDGETKQSDSDVIEGNMTIFDFIEE